VIKTLCLTVYINFSILGAIHKFSGDLMKYLFALVFLSTSLLAHEIKMATSVIDIPVQRETGTQQDLFGRFNLNQDWDAGLHGTHLKRYNYFENRLGAFVTYRPSDRTTLELRSYFARDVQLIPEQEIGLSVYHALSDGLTTFMSYRNSRYSVTDVESIALGFEIEKIVHWIFIPQIMAGTATFRRPAETKNLYSVGARVVYHHEEEFGLFAFGFRGAEASQAVVGDSSQLINTLTGGLGGNYHITRDLIAEISIEHTDYGNLKVQFITSQFNLKWRF
jgi:hypothetical protein